MSSAVLREAAALMRSRAEAATEGPWVRSGSSIETDHACSPSHDCWPVGDTYTGMKPDGSTSSRDLNRADAEHIASWHPAVALAVAGWLDVMADRFDSRLSSALMQTDDVDKAIRACEHLARRELAVARTYLGDQS